MQPMDKTTALIINAKRLQQANKLEPAKEIYNQILQQDPNNVDVLHLMGILHHQLRAFDIAINYFQKVMALNPNIPQLYHNLGLAYKEQGQLDEAIIYYRKALALRPQYFEVFEKLGNTFFLRGEYQAAIDHYQNSLQINPKNADAWLNCSIAFQTLEMYEEAEEAAQNAVRLAPNSAATLIQMGGILNIKKQITAAIDYYNKALKIAPNHIQAYSNLAEIHDNICYWDNYTEREHKLYEAVQTNNKLGISGPVNLLTALTKSWQPAVLLNLATNNAKPLAQQAEIFKKQFNFQFNTKKRERLKIGYISTDFNNHPVSLLTKNLYHLHDRKQFEIYCFSLGIPTDHLIRKYIAATCDHFLDCCFLQDNEVIEKIHASNIDILVDLNGYTRGARPKILAARPAPLQASYLGYLGTTGANYIDYVIADEIVVTPVMATQGYSEQLVYLPCYQIFDNQQTIADKPLKRSDYGLPADAFIYCCLNNTYKIKPDIFSVWMEILRKTPNSVLWLLSTSELAENNLRKEAEKAGISANRLYFAKFEEREIYLARYRLANLFLDTPAYNANTTGSDALWAGLPMITTPGTTYAGRGASSSLIALGLPELVLPNLDAYRDLAIEFYNNPEKLKQTKEKLERNRLTQPLFDTSGFVRNLEKAYKKMWEIYASGQAPQQIKIEDVSFTEPRV